MKTISKAIVLGTALVLAGICAGPAAANYVAPPPPAPAPPAISPWNLPPRDYTVPTGPTIHAPYGPACTSCRGPEPFEQESAAPISDAPTREDMERDAPAEVPSPY